MAFKLRGKLVESFLFLFELALLGDEVIKSLHEHSSKLKTLINFRMGKFPVDSSCELSFVGLFQRLLSSLAIAVKSF
jgi:hypothetical protein